jgi:hypothetical protein
MTLDVVISSSLVMSQSLGINTAPTDCATGTYNVNLVGGSGTGATAQAVVTGADPTAPTLSTVMVLNPGRGYVVGDSLTIASGDLGTGQLVTNQPFTNNGLIPNVANNITREIAVYTTTGQGGTVSVKSDGGVITVVKPVNIGTGYLENQTITISQDQLTNVGFGVVSSDYTNTLISDDVANSSAASMLALTSSNINTNVFQAKIAAGGSGYEVGETITVNGAEIGNSTDAVFNLTLNDFTENGARSYWTMDVLPTSSLMFSSPQVTGSTFNGFFEQDIEFVSVYAETERMDVEYVVVNSDNA